MFPLIAAGCVLQKLRGASKKEPCNGNRRKASLVSQKGELSKMRQNQKMRNVLYSHTNFSSSSVYIFFMEDMS